MKNWLVLSALVLATGCSSSTTTSGDASSSSSSSVSSESDTGMAETAEETAPEDTGAETTVLEACQACITTNCSTEYAADCPNGKAGATACDYTGTTATQPNVNGAITCEDIVACLAADQGGCDYLNNPGCSPGFESTGQFGDIYNCVTVSCATECGF